MKVSIITVCKNSEHTLERAIQSVVHQTYSNIEYIVIDGDSTDNTKKIINRYLHQIAHFVSETDDGVYQAMNKGIRLASGDWIYFVNSDDYLFDNNVIQDLVHFVSTNSDCHFVYGDHEARYTTGDSNIHKPAPPEQMLEEMVSLGECMIQPACFFQAELFRKLGLFDETYNIAADYEWFARLLQDSSLKLCYYPRTLVSYAHGGLSGNIPALFAEVFAIQNSIPLYQQEPWLSKRMQKLQQSFIEKYDLLERTHQLSLKRLHHIEAVEAHVKNLEKQIQTLEAKLTQATANTSFPVVQMQAELDALQSKAEALQARITAMETSKFWQIRTAWFKLKRLLGLPADNE
ncbi:glycosyltransferase family 2 protein [Leptolyngbya sp. 7M]|uniref:glycosyltransferase family 2 protein n=1 Tax=Leptolyngbya sp. 7M TaxID=2812896 RepID=UPI001B8C2FC8|nr:glycosyltransferase [Leptolyngbya sp. 7M]QYO62239.1 glycosyltransferase [Leptolyngbya sp. 7M]